MIGEDPLFSERIYEKMYNGSRWKPALERGHSQPGRGRRGVTMEAISGVDIAVWDVKAQALGVPIYQAMGAARDSVRAYGSGGWAPGDDAEAEMAGYAAKGFSAVKMRVVGHDDFSTESTVRRVEAARRGIGPDVELMVDAHGALDVSTAIRLAARLEEYDISWFEEPVSPDDHAGMAEVRSSTSIPIAAGESEFTRFDFLDLFEHRAIDIAQPEVARSGGITETRRIATMASARGVRLAPHAWGSGVLFAAAMHVAMAGAELPHPGGEPGLYADDERAIRGVFRRPRRPGLRTREAGSGVYYPRGWVRAIRVRRRAGVRFLRLVGTSQVRRPSPQSSPTGRGGKGEQEDD